MPDTVLRVSTVSMVDNPAAMEEKIDELIAAKYSGPGWVRQGPNHIINSSTGEVVNLNQEATAILQDEGPRKDAVAIIQTPEGEQKQVWVNQDAVVAAGGDMNVLRDNLQHVITTSPLSDVPAWVWIAGAAGVGLLFLRGRSSRYGRR